MINLRKAIKNFRFWILIVGMIFLAVGFVMRKLGIPPCEGVLTFVARENTLYLFGEMFVFLGGVFSFMGSILLIAQFFVKVLKGL